jgi:hypothetical protein
MTTADWRTCDPFDTLEYGPGGGCKRSEWVRIGSK